MTEPLRTHVFVRGRWRDWRGEPICQCGSAKGSSIHRVAERTEEEKAVEARKLGEDAGAA